MKHNLFMELCLPAACYARLHTCKDFLDDMKAAQKEGKKKKK